MAAGCGIAGGAGAPPGSAASGTTVPAPGAPTDRDGRTSPGRDVVGYAYRGVVIDPDGWADIVNVGGWYAPTDTEIAAVESHLVESLKATSAHDRLQVIGRLTEYQRQYSGQVRNGRRVLVINAACDASITGEPQWRVQQVVVADGGSCFWNAVIDTTDFHAVVFQVNGAA